MTGSFGDPVLPGFRPDPSVCRAGADYYAVTSSFEWFPGLPVFHSRDLVNWRRLGSALDRASQLDLDGCEPSRGLFAPTIRHHDGVFHLVCTLMDGPGHFVVTATDPAGPWSEPHWLEGDGFDPSLFFDDGPDDGDGDGDGRAWFTAARVRDEAAGRTEIWMREYLPLERRLTGPEHVLWSGSRPGARWSEAPHLYKTDGTYLLLTAEGGTDVDHSVVAARADRVTGPYRGAPGNPVLPPATGPTRCTGHADLVRTPDGDWWAVLLGVRPGSAIGRETFLSRITWDDGWPVFSPSGHIGLRRPLHDDFATLSADWNTLRTPRTRFWSTGDGLRLHLRPERLGDRTTPSLLARPQEHPDCDVSTELRFTPAAPDEQAGLAVVLDDDTHLLLLLHSTEGLSLRQGPDVLARVPVPPGPVRLGVRIRGFRHTFAYAASDGTWQDLATVEATFLTPLFTSIQLGLYATSNGRVSTNQAHFPWFDITYPSRQ